MDDQLGSPGAKLRNEIQAIGARGLKSAPRIRLGTIISATPLRIQPDGSALTLEQADVVVADHLIDRTVSANISGWGAADITINDGLRANDRIILASTDGGQSHYVIARIGGG